MVRIATVLKPLRTQLARSTDVARRGLGAGRRTVSDATRRSRRLLHR